MDKVTSFEEMVFMDLQENEADDDMGARRHAGLGHWKES